MPKPPILTDRRDRAATGAHSCQAGVPRNDTRSCELRWTPPKGHEIVRSGAGEEEWRGGETRCGRVDWIESGGSGTNA